MKNNRLTQKKFKARRSNVSFRGYRPAPSLFRSGPIVKRWIDYYTTIETSSSGSPVFKPYNETFIELPVVLERLAEASQFKDNAKNWRIKDLYMEFTPLTDDPTLPPILVGIDIDPNYLATNPTLTLKTGSALRVIRRRHRLTKRDLSNAKDLVFHDGPLLSSDMYLTIAWQPGITTIEEAKAIYAVHLGFGVQFQLADKVSYSSNILVSLDKMRAVDHAAATKVKEVIEEGIQCNLMQEIEKEKEKREKKIKKKEKYKKLAIKKREEEKKKVIQEIRKTGHVDDQYLPAYFAMIREPPQQELDEKLMKKIDKLIEKYHDDPEVNEAGLSRQAIQRRMVNAALIFNANVEKSTIKTLLKTENKLYKEKRLRRHSEDFQEEEEEDEEQEDEKGEE